MTAWHHDEPFEEAWWHFSVLATPSESHVFTDFERFEVVGNPNWADQMNQTLAAYATKDLETE